MSEQARGSVIDIASSPEDLLLRHEAAAYAGRVIAGDTLILDYIPETTLDKLALAEAGDRRAMLSVAANVHTELVEWTRKTKNIVQSRSEVLQDGSIVQHGHAWRDIQANTLLRRTESAVLQQRARTELVHNFRIEQFVQDGTLADHYFLVVSPVPDYLSSEVAEKEAFFAESMSLAVQATTLDTYGVLTESAFVAGADGRDQPRFDVATIQRVYAALGVNIADCSSEEILARPLLIPKSMLSHGVADFVKLYDELSGEQRFFGVKGATGDYDTFADTCFQDERQFDELALRITQQLIAERGLFAEPIDVVHRIATLAKRNLVARSQYDTTIDPLVFGREAATHIERVRMLLERGDVIGAQSALKKAQETAKGGACGTYSGAERQQSENGEQDWSGGSKEKFAKCKSCKSFKFEIGGCKICEDCVKKPWVMQKAWDEYVKEERKKRTTQKSKAIERLREAA